MPVTDNHVRAVCKPGHLHETCRYLCVDKDGFFCAKFSELRDQLDARVAAANITARGDNCRGWDDSKQREIDP